MATFRSTGTFGSAPAPAAAGGLGGYQSAYNSALQQNQQLYQNVLGGYRDVIAQQRRETDPIVSGYGDLQRQVQGQYGDLAATVRGLYQPLAQSAYDTLGRHENDILSGYGNTLNMILGQIDQIGGAQSQAITDQYARQRGASRQGLASAGLGNTTVASAVDRGLTYDESKSRNDLSERLAGLRASNIAAVQLPALNFWERAGNSLAGQLNRMGEYSSAQQAQLGGAGIDAYRQLGLSGLGYQGQVQNERNALEQSYLNFAASPTIGYPDAQPYMQQAQLLYQAQQDQLAQQEAKKASDLAISLGLRPPPAAGQAGGLGSGYMPSSGPSGGSGGYVPLSGAGGGILGYDNMNVGGFYSNLLRSAGKSAPVYPDDVSAYKGYGNPYADPGSVKGSEGYY